MWRSYCGEVTMWQSYWQPSVYYVARISEEAEKPEELTVSYLRRSPNISNAFYFPEVSDEHAVAITDIGTKLLAPHKSTTTRLARYRRFPSEVYGVAFFGVLILLLF